MQPNTWEYENYKRQMDEEYKKRENNYKSNEYYIKLGELIDNKTDKSIDK